MAPMPPVTIAPMEARLVEALPEDEGWQYEPKWDGFRCLAHRDGAEVDLRAKSGKPLNRFFPDVVERIRALKQRRFVIDGELIISVGRSMSFEALQARLHPAASRVAKLAAEQPAQFVAFDCLHVGARSFVDAPLAKRRAALEALLAAPSPCVRLSPYTRDVRSARKWLARTGRALDGVVAKRLDGPYVSGERAMLKVKRIRTADCVVGGFRYASEGKVLGSLLLGLYDDDRMLHHVGFTSAFSASERGPILDKLKKIAGGPSFTGRAPGGPSRWSTERTGEWVSVKPKLVVEVRYDQVTDDRFRHGTRLVRWRPDKAPHQCTFDQLAPPLPPAEVSALLK